MAIIHILHSLKYYFTETVRRQKRSLNDPITTVSEIKYLLEEANKVSFQEVPSNLVANFGFGVKVLNRTASHLRKPIR